MWSLSDSSLPHLFGNMKNLAITSSHLKNALDNKVMFDASSVEGFVRVEESDMYLYPDYSTFATFPWRPQQGKVARLICDVYRPDGSCYEGDPRYVLKKIISEADSMGYTFNVGPECEFFLYHVDDDGMPTTITHEQAGYFDMSPLDFGENARRDMTSRWRTWDLQWRLLIMRILRHSMRLILSMRMH